MFPSACGFLCRLADPQLPPIVERAHVYTWIPFFDELAHALLSYENRQAELSKVFGEAMMLIEADKRGHEVLLAYSQDDETFTIPPNVHLIRTMNTADRSLAMVDYALRRRFCFVDVAPAFCTDEGTKRFQEQLIKNGASKQIVQEIITKMRTVNERPRVRTLRGNAVVSDVDQGS